MTPQDAIAESILATKALAARYFAGFTDETRTRQPPGLPNHLAWSLGHLALTMHRVAEKIDGAPPPEADFAPGHAAPSTPPPQRFHFEDISFGSTPVDDPARYPSLGRCTAIFDAAIDRFAATYRAATDARLDQTTPWGAGTATLRSLGGRLVFHNGMHTGQLADLRRALGFKSIFA
ncbi:MAG: DinB family protein [Phycisphaerales bacterium]